MKSLQWEEGMFDEGQAALLTWKNNIFAVELFFGEPSDDCKSL